MIKIRRFIPEDQKSVQELISDIMNKEFHDEAAAYPSGDIANIPETYGGLGEAFFVAAQNGDIIGTIAVKKEDDRVALMRRLFVSEAHRKQQIGMRLIERALQFCGEVGYQEIIFKTTSRMEGANKVCQKCGFVQRAKLHMGTIELLKFSLPLRDRDKVKK
jgi:GNAT superfamily N-acetyltransferase